MTQTNDVPRWDTGTIFPALDSQAFNDAHERLVSDLARLEQRYEDHDVRAGPPIDVGPDQCAAFDQVLLATNSLQEQMRLVSAYLHAFVSTDARDEAATAMQSKLQAETAGLSSLMKRFHGWVARLGPDALIQGSPAAADHEFALRRAEIASRFAMSEGEEALAADLSLTGARAWARLHRETSALLMLDVTDPDGSTTTLPMSKVRSLAFDPSPDVRRRAYEAELEAWAGNRVALGAALNNAKGEQITLNSRRGWPDALAPALFANNIERGTLDAMHEAVGARFADFRRYLKAKANALGQERLPWWDLFAPVDSAAPRFDWISATGRVRDAFATYSGPLAEVVDEFTTNSWIDAEPREGKATGAFCMPIRDGESRVFLNFDGSFNSVQTLAHELGHAFHNTNLAHRTPLQRQTPMALAETASIFCETIMVQSGLEAADDRERLTILDTDLQNATQVVVDIHSRFLFESELCERRRHGSLSSTDLCELMVDAQDQTYGDGLHPEHRHPYMWAVKGHYFTPFYNWPYCFGLLFGIGLYARYQQDPDRFRSGYETLLSSTGLGPASTLAATFGIDVDDPAFWSSSLDVIVSRIDDFESLVHR